MKSFLLMHGSSIGIVIGMAIFVLLRSKVSRKTYWRIAGAWLFGMKSFLKEANPLAVFGFVLLILSIVWGILSPPTPHYADREDGIFTSGGF